jgi:hypothetical protein
MTATRECRVLAAAGGTCCPTNIIAPNCTSRSIRTARYTATSCNYLFVLLIIAPSQRWSLRQSPGTVHADRLLASSTSGKNGNGFFRHLSDAKIERNRNPRLLGSCRHDRMEDMGREQRSHTRHWFDISRSPTGDVPVSQTAISEN